ncbi:hypothetical protein KDW_05190 [Dictyobacter vulcani]|uniref:Polysaccharide chain length determinant N-terminal domain-containing protein n=1 Tax=Dictyobacter vulcani TaxID=2607529 RepID=A0A5J4KIR6_9CHLR|nr:Wzz/FepE/Etk N-terminal domain-containing protein [Dictyobacter vulcani]GER86357.1 hypothetical protein KDW_05190 [Dictyobacter vulcani]
MTSEYYWTVLFKRWKLLAICIVVVGLGTYIGSRLITPIYQSTVLVRVTIHTTGNSADYDNLLASNQLLQTEAQLATSGPVLREVASRYPGLTVDQLTKETTTASKLNTQLFEITVQDVNPIRAATLANDVAATLIKQQVQENTQDNGQSQKQIQHEVDATHHSIDKTAAQITNLELQVANLEQQVNTQAQTAALQLRIAGLQSQLNRLQGNYSQWQTMLAQLEINMTKNHDFLRTVQPAQAATVPVKPQMLLNTASGLAAGLFLGMVLAFLIEQLDTRVRTPEDLAQLFDWPVLGLYGIWAV